MGRIYFICALIIVLLTNSEKELLESLKHGDKAAMKVIFSDFHNTLCNVAFRIVSDEDDAKDIVQDVFLKLWHNCGSLVIQISLKAYLKRALITLH